LKTQIIALEIHIGRRDENICTFGKKSADSTMTKKRLAMLTRLKYG